MATRTIGIAVLCYFVVVPYALCNGDSVSSVINAFVVPHSHMDVGWVYTVDESMVAYAANVYTSVVSSLVKNGKRRFIAVEQEFFRLWWENVADVNQKQQVHELLQNGQLEFIIGGQVMNDEAVTEYSANIQQLTEGHSFIYDTFGVRPQFSWHVDPFGATATTPALFAMAAFNSHLISRIDYDKKDAMQKKKEMQFIWQGSPSHGSKLQMFTHTMDQYSYCAPGDIPFSERSGFYWNGYVKFPVPPSDGIYPNMSLPVNTSNIKLYADYMVANIKQRAAWYKTQQLLWPWGCDKQFFNATIQFLNMDPLLDYINQHSDEYGVRVQYATVGEYFKAVHDTNSTWMVKKSGDFIPYSSDPHSAWTGFYSSRNYLKGLSRHSQATLHAAESMFTMYNKVTDDKHINGSWILSKLDKLRWASAEVQHHDGVPGTESPAVKIMYIQHLKEGFDNATDAMAEMMSDLVSPSEGCHSDKLSSQVLNDDKNTGIANENSTIPIIVYNPLGWSVKRYVHINVSTQQVSVKDSDGSNVPAQVNSPAYPADSFHLYFYSDLPAVGYKTYFISIGGSNSTLQHHKATEGKVHRQPIRLLNNKKLKKKTTGISNNCYDVTFDEGTSLLYSITDKTSDKTVKISHLFKEYNSNYDVTHGIVSDNYVFRPMGSARMVTDNKVDLQLVKGQYVQEARQSYYSFLEPNISRFSVIVRLFNTPPLQAKDDETLCGHIELQFRVGPLSINKELITRFSTNLTNGKVIYTDENAYQMMKRNFRKNTTEPIAQNYYPMVSTAYIEDEKKDLRLTLLSERSHGVSSLTDGQMEVMLHRRLINNQEMAQNYNLTLNDTSVVMPTLWLLLGNKVRSSYLQHRGWLELENPPVVIVINQSCNDELKELDKEFSIKHIAKDWKTHYKTSDTVMSDLPDSLHLLTLKTPGWMYDSNHEKHQQEIKDRGTNFTFIPNLERILLRLHHMYAVGEHPTLSNSVTVNLNDIFSPMGNIISLQERSLTGIWAQEDVQRWTWATHQDDGVHTSESNSKDKYSVTLNPKDIKTYFMEIQKPGLDNKTT